MDEVCLAWRGFNDEIKFKIIIEMIGEMAVYDLPLGKAIKWAGNEVPLKLLAYMDIGLAANEHMITQATYYIIDAIGFDYVAEYYFKYIHHYRKLTFSTVGKAIMQGLPADGNIFNWLKNIYRAEGRHLIFIFHMCAGCHLCEISHRIYSAIDQLNRIGRLDQLKAEILKSLPDIAEDQFNIEYGMVMPLKLCNLYSHDIKKKLDRLQDTLSNGEFDPNESGGFPLYPNGDHYIS